MTSDPPPPEAIASDATWREIDQVVQGLAELTKSHAEPTQYYATLLEQMVLGLGASGGAVWIYTSEGTLKRQCILNPLHPWLADETAAADRHPGVVEGVIKCGKSKLIPPGRRATEFDATANPTTMLLAISPWSVDQQPSGALELFLQPTASPEAQQGYLKVLEIIGDLAAEHDRNQQLRCFRQSVADSARLDQFARRVHRSLDLREAAYTIANESRHLLSVDRVSILVRQQGHYRLLAVSGVDAVHRRANFTQRLQRLGQAVVAQGEPLWYPFPNHDTPPQIEQMVGEYLDEAHARAMVIVPLSPQDPAETARPVKAVGILVAERFYGMLDERQRAALLPACEHVAQALDNALDLATLPFARPLRKIRSWFGFSRWMKAVGLVAAVAAAATAFFCIPADFNVTASGELLPSRMRDVFARADGVVSDLQAEHDRHVHAGELLATLRRPQLDLEFKQVWGELQTARKKLATSQAERLQLSRDSDESRKRYGQLAGQVEELQEIIQSLEAQYAILQKKQSESEVRSPIDGEVITWNVKQLLEDRPVNRGQVLLTVGDLAGPWRLELRVPDRSVAHVLRMREESGRDLEITYVLAMEPHNRLSGKIHRLGMRSETSESGETCLLASADVDRAKIERPIPGAGVKAAIHCGRRSLGYVWLHDFLDAVRTWLLF